MKKWILLCAAVALLVIPFSVVICKDGGTRIYSAAAYKVVQWRRLTGEEGARYEHTDVYPFPISLLSVDELWERKQPIVDSTSCTEREPQTYTPFFTEDIARIYPADADAFGKKEPAVIRTRQELLDSTAGDEMADDALSAYDDACFADHALLLIPVTETSTSISHRVTAVTCDEAADCLSVNIDRIKPECCDCAMQYAYILIRIPRQCAAATVEVAYTDRQFTPLTFQAKGIGLSLEIPSGWSWHSVEDDNACGQLLRLYRHDSGGEPYMEFYRAKAFGVCGTGLDETTTELGDHPVRIGTYDGKRTWDFVVFTDWPGDCVAINHGLTGEDAAAALGILKTVNIDRTT